MISTQSFSHPSATIHPCLSSLLCCLSSSSLVVVGTMSRVAGAVTMCNPENGGELGSRGPRGHSEEHRGTCSREKDDLLRINLRGEEEKKGGSAFPKYHKLPSS